MKHSTVEHLNFTR